MNKYLAARMRIASILMAAALGTSTFVAPNAAQAQSTSEKIQLMAETLRARDSGNLALAKEKAEELIRVAPSDQNVQRLLASINGEIERRSGGAAVYGQAPNVPLAVAMQAPGGSMSTADAMVAVVSAEQDAKISAAENAIEEAEKLAELGAYSDAAKVLDSASTSLTLNMATADVISEIEEAKAEVVLAEAEAMAAAGDPRGAEVLMESYYNSGGRSKDARELSNNLSAQIADPYELSIAEISPQYVAQTKVIRDLLARGRAQYLNGDYDGAAATYREVEARDAHNAEAKLFQTRISEAVGAVHEQNFYKTRTQMLTEVDQNWERPKVFAPGGSLEPKKTQTGLQERIENIVIPQINFSGIELTRVIETLSAFSYEYASNGEGVNIVPLFNPNTTGNPKINLTLKGSNLDTILSFVTQQVGYAYDVGNDAITISPDSSQGGGINTVTEFFPISRATRIRLTGFRDGGGSSSGPVDPFAAPSTGGGSAGASADEETEALQAFFQRAGVNFDLAGASIAFDGEQLIVTQTRRNLDRMRTILRNYNEVKQVEIETKFLEVSQNDLQELGFDWGINNGSQPILGTLGQPVLDQNGNPTVTFDRSLSTQGRTISDTFGSALDDSAITINGVVEAVNAAPDLATSIDLAAGATSLFTSSGWSVNGVDVNLAIRALSRQTGSDLMSAPKVTVLSGKRATITVAQELRYPESYGDIESTVSSNQTGGSAISITAGTPQDFVTRNVGVEMSVTPNVENDDTISLILEPRVTEFEGFVEYGGPSIAIAAGTRAVVPAGFYQPIFSTREMSTEVTVFDGATVVMGGLTRDEVKTVNDKVPVLGDIPGLGRLFRSEGETRQKRNLLIFVTANLVSPGGSPARQSYRNVGQNSLFQNPTIMTPSGAANRSIAPDAE